MQQVTSRSLHPPGEAAFVKVGREEHVMGRRGIEELLDTRLKPVCSHHNVPTIQRTQQA